MDIINCTKKWEKSVDVLVYVAMGCLENHGNGNLNRDIIMHKLAKNGAVRTAWIKAMLRDINSNSKKYLYFLNDFPAWFIN